MIDIDLIYYGDVESKRQCGVKLFEKHGPALLNSGRIQECLKNLDTFSKALHGQMSSMTMFSLCIDCAQSPTGGCCSYYMANETDSVLILINFLLGIKVEPQRDDLFECCYLGKKGCILKVKPMFCLNYNCHKIMSGNGVVTLKKLETSASAVLREQTLLEDLILRHIRNS